jgi:glyoxylase-like metal-dependent hydrolase (beta-lactamase superfamily II)
MLCSSLLLTVGLAIGGPASGPYDYEQVDIGPGVYGFFEKKLQPVVSSNIVAVVGNDAVLVFDTGHHPRITRQIIGDLKRLTDKPVRYAVVSHWHDDHWVGNADFAEAYPGIQIIAHPFTAGLMEERKEKFRGEHCKFELERDSKPYREQAASGKQADGSPLSDAMKARFVEVVAATDEQIAQCDEMRYRGVDRKVSGKTTIDLGGRKVELWWLGRANTAGDLVAYLPESRTLLTGDILVHPFPFATQSYISEWAKVLRKIDRMDLATIVPGHGPVLHDKKYLEDVAAVLESIESQARAAYRPGMTADELRAKIDLKSFSESFSHGDGFIKANFDYMMNQPAIERMWQELSGKWQPEGDE